MPIIEYKKIIFIVDEEGFLENFNDWRPEWAEYAATVQGIISLADEHWKLIHILQDYYKKNGLPPMARMVSKETGFKMKRIFELFPEGPGKGACKIAGLPKPKGCV